MQTVLDSNNHSVFALFYHLVLVVKYRRHVIDDAVKISENKPENKETAA